MICFNCKPWNYTVIPMKQELKFINTILLENDGMHGKKYWLVCSFHSILTDATKIIKSFLQFQQNYVSQLKWSYQTNVKDWQTEFTTKLRYNADIASGTSVNHRASLTHRALEIVLSAPAQPILLQTWTQAQISRMTRPHRVTQS